MKREQRSPPDTNVATPNLTLPVYQGICGVQMGHLRSPLVVLLVATTLLGAVNGQLSIASNSSFTGIVSGGVLQVNVSFSSWAGNFNTTFQFPTGTFLNPTLCFRLRDVCSMKPLCYSAAEQPLVLTCGRLVGSVFLDTDNTARYWQATTDINITYAPVSNTTIDYNRERSPGILESSNL